MRAAVLARIGLSGQVPLPGALTSMSRWSDQTSPHAPGTRLSRRSKRLSDAMLENELDASNPSSAASKRGSGYAVYDPLGQKIGNAEELFMNRDEEPEYVRVRIGLFWRKSVLIPVQFAEVDNERETLVLK